MQHANAPPGSDEGRKHGSFWSTLAQVANKIDDQVFLFAVVISIILLGVAIFASARGTPDTRFIAAIIATLAFAVIILSFVGKLLRVEERQNIQQKQINDLVTLSMSPRVFRHLTGITILKEYLYREGMQEDGNDVGILFRREFYHLKDRGFIGPDTLEFNEHLNGVNLAGLAKPTPLGLTYLEVRRKDLLEDDECKKWMDHKNTKMRTNLSIEAVEGLGLRVAGDGTVSAP
jgi:hypothetical protein